MAGLEDLAGFAEALNIADATLTVTQSSWSVVAEASQAIIDASHRAAPGVKIRSLRGTLYAFRGRLSSQHRIFVGQLHARYSSQRHVGPTDTVKKAAEIARAIEQSIHDDFDPCAKAAAAGRHREEKWQDYMEQRGAGAAPQARSKDNSATLQAETPQGAGLGGKAPCLPQVEGPLCPPLAGAVQVDNFFVGEMVCDVCVQIG